MIIYFSEFGDHILQNITTCELIGAKIRQSGLMKQTGSRLWFASLEHPSGELEEFNEDCHNPIKDHSQASPRSDHDQLFTYSLEDIDKLSDQLSIPWEISKDHPFSLSTVYIGFKWDLHSRIVSLAPNKVQKYRDTIVDWLSRPSHVLKDVQQLYGKLLHASAVIPKGCAYLMSLERMLKVCSDKPFMLHHSVKAVANVLLWWDEQLRNGWVSLPLSPPLSFVDLQAFSDASSGMGIGIVIGDRWRAWRLILGWKESRGAKRDISWVEAIGFELLV